MQLGRCPPPQARIASACSAEPCTAHHSDARFRIRFLAPWIGSLELTKECRPEEVVIAKPDAFVVEWHEEQIRLLDLLEHSPGIIAGEGGVTELRAHPGEHRRLSQETELSLREPGEICVEVVGDEAVGVRLAEIRK